MTNDIRFSALPMPAPFEDREMCRRQIIDLLCREEYGFLPPPPDRMQAETLLECGDFCAGKAFIRSVRLTVWANGRSASFPFSLTAPWSGSPLPAVVFLNFRSSVPDEYLPIEEICDHGTAVASVCYTDVSSDDGNFTDGIAALFAEEGRRAADAPGKLMIWAWAAMRVLDYLLTCPELDSSRIAVGGHSRLGKTALLAGGLDERFYAVWSNDSGCSGAALSRNKTGERIADITRNFPYWFCPRYASWAEKEEQAPFDQHWLLMLTAPRPLYVASAQLDDWADPAAEFRGCACASAAWERLGFPGLGAEEMPPVNSPLRKGRIGYHIRSGTHAVSRYDWTEFLAFLSSQK